LVLYFVELQSLVNRVTVTQLDTHLLLLVWFAARNTGQHQRRFRQCLLFTGRDNI